MNDMRLINAAVRVVNQAAMAERIGEAMVRGQWRSRSRRQGNRGPCFFPTANGGELAVLYCFAFLFIAASGSGIWSVDAARGNS